MLLVYLQNIFLVVKMNVSICKTKVYFLLLFLCLNISALKSQSYSETFPVDIKWKGIENLIVNSDTIKYISFENSVCNDYRVENSIYRYSFPIHSNEVEIDLFIDNLKFERVPENELVLLKTVNDTLPSYNYYIKTSRNDNSLCLEINPFFKEKDVVVRLLSCDVHYSLKGAERKANYYSADNSVLASGRWYQMSLSSTGVYLRDTQQVRAVVSQIRPDDDTSPHGNDRQQ